MTAQMFVALRDLKERGVRIPRERGKGHGALMMG
jgi:hypothetical protein